MILTNAYEGGTRIWLGDTEITDYVTSANFTPAEPLAFAVEAGREYRLDVDLRYDVPPIRLTMRGSLNPRAYRLLFGLRHPRIHRLRSAHRRKTKGWR